MSDLMTIQQAMIAQVISDKRGFGSTSLEIAWNMFQRFGVIMDTMQIRNVMEDSPHFSLSPGNHNEEKSNELKYVVSNFLGGGGAALSRFKDTVRKFHND